MPIRALLADAFGTLVDLGVKRWPYARLAQLAARPEAGRLVMTRSLGLVEAAQALGVPLEPAEHARLEQDLVAELDGLFPFPEVAEVLGDLRERGIKIAVISNLAEPYGRALRRALPVEPDLWVMSYEVGLVKPDPAIFAFACRRLDVAAPEALMVGDSLRADVFGARAAGVAAVHLDRRGAERAGYDGPSISDLTGVRSFVV